MDNGLLESWRRTSLIYLENACGRFPRNSLRSSCAGPSQSLETPSGPARLGWAVNKYYLFKKPYSHTLGFVHRSEAARLPRNYKDVEEALSDDGDGCLIQYRQGCLTDIYFLLEDHNTHTLGVVHRWYPLKMPAVGSPGLPYGGPPRPWEAAPVPIAFSIKARKVYALGFVHRYN